MNEIQKFYNPLFGELRTLETAEGKVLICGTDAAKAYSMRFSRPSESTVHT